MIRFTAVAVMFALSAAFLAAPQANAQSPDPALLAPGQSGRMLAPRYPASRSKLHAREASQRIQVIQVSDRRAPITSERAHSLINWVSVCAFPRAGGRAYSPRSFGIGVDLGAPHASQANHQSPGRVTVDCPQIDRPARAAAGTEDIEPRRPGQESGPDGERIGPRTRSAAPTPPTRQRSPYIGGITHAARPTPASTPSTNTAVPMTARTGRIVSNSGLRRPAGLVPCARRQSSRPRCPSQAPAGER
jgi:hypothetical protein